MYAICSTKKNDVKECIKKMVEEGHSYPVYQFGQRQYKKLEQGQVDVVNAVWGRKITHIITKDGQIHKLSCRKAKSANAIKASLSRIALTGLKKCSCMK